MFNDTKKYILPATIFLSLSLLTRACFNLYYYIHTKYNYTPEGKEFGVIIYIIVSILPLWCQITSLVFGLWRHSKS